MRKNALVGILVVALVALLSVGTWAWFTAEAEPVTNTFKAGTVDIEIVDVFEPVTNWNPGDSTEKEVSIKNTGTNCALVRVKLISEWGNIAEDESFVVDTSLAANNVTLDINDVDWTEAGGYYYYNYFLPAGETTALLLDGVKLAGQDTDNKYQGKAFQIRVEADAVQCTNDAYIDIWGSAIPDNWTPIEKPGL